MNLDAPGKVDRVKGNVEERIGRSPNVKGGEGGKRGREGREGRDGNLGRD